MACAEGGGNAPRKATASKSLTQDNRAGPEAQLEFVAALATRVLNSLKALQPGEVEIEFDVALGEGKPLHGVHSEVPGTPVFILV